MREENYEMPLIRVVDFCVECGFSASQQGGIYGSFGEKQTDDIGEDW